MTVRLFRLSIGACALCASIATNANVIYSYSGNFFQSAQTPYTTDMHVIGELILDSALAPNTVYGGKSSAMPPSQPGYWDALPGFVSATFSDGINSITNTQTAMGTTTVFMVTGASGEIVQWALSLLTGSPLTELSNIYTYKDPFSATNTNALGIMDGGSFSECSVPGTNPCLTTGASAFNSYVPGTWTMSNGSAVSEPAAWALLGVGLMGLGVFRRKQH